MRRGLQVASVLAGAAVLAGGGWIAGRRIKSPDAAARDAAPPPAGTITVPVESRVLSTNVITRGAVRYDEGSTVRVAKGTGAAGVVTRSSPEVGGTIVEGALVVETDSRPTVVFTGELPSYRDITPGTQGDDVRQLQAALTRLGVYNGPVDGTFGPAAQDAVAAYYRKMGYEPRPPSKAERDAVVEAQRRLDVARDAVRQSGNALTAAQAGPKVSERMRLDADVKRARDELAKAQAARQPAIDDANQAVNDATLEAAAADAARDTAVGARTTARAGTNPDTGVHVTAGELAGFERAATDAELAARRAHRTLDDAAAKADATPAAQDALIAAAQEGVTLAVQTRTEALAAVDTAALESAANDAARSLSDAERALADATAAAGVVVPESELVFLKDLPRRIDQSDAVRGEPLPDTVMAVSGTELVVEATVSSADRRFVRKDAKVQLDEQSQGIALDGTVSFVAEQPGTGSCNGSAAGAGSGGSGSGSGGAAGGGSPGGGGSGSGGSGGAGSATDRFCVRIKPGTLPAKLKPTDLRGVNLRVTIPVQSTNGKVNAVPVAALSAGADGTPRVDVEDQPGAAPRSVPVRTGLSAGGYVEVTAIDGALKVGDRVVVGRKASTSGTSTGGATTVAASKT